MKMKWKWEKKHIRNVGITNRNAKLWPSNYFVANVFETREKINFQKQPIHFDSMLQNSHDVPFDMDIGHICDSQFEVGALHFSENHTEHCSVGNSISAENPLRKNFWTASNKLTILVKVVEVKMNRHKHRKKLSLQIVTQTNQMTSNAFITYNFQIDGFLNG